MCSGGFIRSFVALLLFCLPAAAAVVTGTVRDPDGQPVEGATVQVEGGPETKTGMDGAYRLEVEGTGEKTLTAEFEGLAAIRITIAVADDISLDLRFAQVAPSVQSLTVTDSAGQADILTPDPARRVYIRD